MTAPPPPRDPKGRTPEPSFGADEEGESPLPEGAVDDDKAAWVHTDEPPVQP